MFPPVAYSTTDNRRRKTDIKIKKGIQIVVIPYIEGLSFVLSCSDLHYLFSLLSPSIYFRFSYDVNPSHIKSLFVHVCLRKCLCKHANSCKLPKFTCSGRDFRLGEMFWIPDHNNFSHPVYLKECFA